MYFFFIGTWRLNILKIVVLNIPKLFTLEEALTIPVDTGRKLCTFNLRRVSTGMLYLNLVLSKIL